jgi:uracil permease
MEAREHARRGDSVAVTAPCDREMEDLMEKGRDCVLDVGDRPAPPAFLLLSLQHLFAMFGATVLVPLLTGLDPSVALIASGIGTFVFMACTGGQVPAYLGSSFAFIAPIIAASAIGGPAGAMIGCFVAGLVYVVLAAFLKIFGSDWLMRLLPPVVVGPIVIVIGLGLASVAVQMAQNTAGGGAYSLGHFLVALATLGSILVYALVLRGFFTVVPILLGVLTGYAIAAAAGYVDYTPFHDFEPFAVPDFTLAFSGLPAGVSVWQMILLIAPVALVTLAEHIGHIVVLSRVVGREYLEKPGLARTLIGDGLATSVAALIGGPPNTTYGENIGVLAITRIFSVWVIGGAAVLAIVLGFVGILTAFLKTIPMAVIGGISIALFGVIAAAGIRALIEGKVDLGDRRNLLIVSTILVLGIGGATLHFGEGGFEVSSMALAAVIGVLLNAVLPRRSGPEDRSVV